MEGVKKLVNYSGLIPGCTLAAQNGHFHEKKQHWQAMLFFVNT
jgi:hypothetical protein